jgi:hypothetical protein
MQVSVYLASDYWDGHTRLLVTPPTPKPSKRTLYGHRWRFYGTLDSGSDLFAGQAIELHLQAKGFAIVES